MPLVNLNGLDCEGSFDSSSSICFLSPTTASRLESLDGMTVTCNFLNDCRLVRCVLNFSIKDGLRGDCVLGANFFSQYWDDVGVFLYFILFFKN